MARINIHLETNTQLHPRASATVQKLINVTVTTWHAAFPSGSAVNATSGFTDPSAAEADRIPELALAAGGTPGTYVITGTWDGKARSVSILTVANATVKADLPFDTITSMTGPDPGATLTLNKGDAYAEPAARWVWTSAGGDLAVQLADETAVKVVAALPASIDWARRAQRVRTTGTTIAAGYFVW